MADVIVTAQLFGSDLVQRLLLDVADAPRKKMLRDVMKEGSRMIADAIVSAAPRETGLLSLALGATNVKTYGSKLFATAGVRRGFRRALTVTKGGKLKYQSKKKSVAGNSFSDPTRYIYPLTAGRKEVTANPGSILWGRDNRAVGQYAAAVPPNPFVDRAFSQVQGPVVLLCQSMIETAVDAEVSSHSSGS